MGKWGLCFVMIILTLSGCMALSGIHPYRYASSKQAVTTYLHKHALDTTNVLYLDSASFKKLNADVFKPTYEAGFRPIQLVLFDSTGKVISKYASCENWAKRSVVLSTFPPINLNPIDTTQRIDYLSRLLTNESKKHFEVTMRAHSYGIFVFIGTWTGHYNLVLAKQVQAYADKNHDKNIALFYVDLDKM